MRREILVAAAILLDSRGRVLLVGNDWGRRGRVRYTLPGGTVEPGETAVEALVREVREETGLRVRSVEHLAYVIQVEDRGEVGEGLRGHPPLLGPLRAYLRGERGRFYAYAGWHAPGVVV